MRNIAISFMLAPAMVLLFFVTTHAQTATNLQAELNALLAQLAALQAQLNGAAVGAPTVPVAAGGVTCPTISRTLRLGMSGADVSVLQAFLARDPSVYPEGTVTGYFGGLTQNAIQRFQGKHGIVTSGSPESTGFGAVGPATRATILAVCSGGSSAAARAGTCSLGGVTTPQGVAYTFYSTTQAPLGATCAAYAQVRQCLGGTFSGNAAYQYRSCVESEASSCIVDGERVAHGTAFTFFSKRTVTAAGDSCSQHARTRTCTNGVLSGSNDFKYLSCKADVPDSCSLSGVTLAHGQSRTFYRYDAATSTNACSMFGQSRTCADGVLSGGSEYNRASCSAGACVLDGVTYAHGSSSTFYFAEHIPANEQCASYEQRRTCSGGVFTGNAAYKYRTCTRATSGSCVVDSVVLASGQSRVFYASSTAPLGARCGSVAQTRTCTNGTLSGAQTHNRALCSDTAACLLDGVTVPHGDSFTFYSARTVAFGTTCSSKAQTRVCTNGKFSGTATFQFGSCRVNPPTSLVPSDAQFAAALAALESLLKSALIELDSWF